jgi:hypothetical protein
VTDEFKMLSNQTVHVHGQSLHDEALNLIASMNAAKGKLASDYTQDEYVAACRQVESKVERQLLQARAHEILKARGVAHPSAEQLVSAMVEASREGITAYS